MRAYIASIVSYAFFNQGECNSAALAKGMVVDDSHITLRLPNEKTQKARNKGHRSVRRIAVRDVPGIIAALTGYFTGTVTLDQRKRRWALSPAKDATRWSARTLLG